MNDMPQTPPSPDGLQQTEALALHRGLLTVDTHIDIPWPAGPTSPENTHCLCRHHHRAKQSNSFTVLRLPDGSTLWITRGQWWFRRQPPGY